MSQQLEIRQSEKYEGGKWWNGRRLFRSFPEVKTRVSDDKIGEQRERELRRDAASTSRVLGCGFEAGRRF